MIEKWISDILWTRWGWKGWREDDCDIAFRSIAEKNRIQSAVSFVICALGNNDSAETQAVVDLIVDRRRAKREEQAGGAK